MFALAACENSQNTKETDVGIDSLKPTPIQKNGNTLFKFNNVIFGVPSPYEFSQFINKLSITYNKDYLNPIKNASLYSSKFKKTLNIGVYGTDLGYLNIYEQTQDAISYFSTTKKLADDIGISSIFDQQISKRVEQNMGNKDSLLYLLSNTYRESDAYLKDNQRMSDASCILAGSWIESLYILSRIAKDVKSEAVMQKVAEQKLPLNNLIKILAPYEEKTNPDYVAMVDLLVELAYEYDGIDYKYTYKQPSVDVKNKITTVNSESMLEINNDQLSRITTLIEKLRGNIVK